MSALGLLVLLGQLVLALVALLLAGLIGLVLVKVAAVRRADRDWRALNDFVARKERQHDKS